MHWKSGQKRRKITPKGDDSLVVQGNFLWLPTCSSNSPSCPFTKHPSTCMEMFFSQTSKMSSFNLTRGSSETNQVSSESHQLNLPSKHFSFSSRCSTQPLPSWSNLINLAAAGHLTRNLQLNRLFTIGAAVCLWGWAKGSPLTRIFIYCKTSTQHKNVSQKTHFMVMSQQKSGRSCLRAMLRRLVVSLSHFRCVSCFKMLQHAYWQEQGVEITLVLY